MWKRTLFPFTDREFSHHLLLSFTSVKHTNRSEISRQLAKQSLLLFFKDSAILSTKYFYKLPACMNNFILKILFEGSTIRPDINPYNLKYFLMNILMQWHTFHFLCRKQHIFMNITFNLSIFDSVHSQLACCS